MSTFTAQHLRALLKEFGELLAPTSQGGVVSSLPKIGSVVVLSAPPVMNGPEHIDDNRENNARIAYAHQLSFASHGLGSTAKLYLNGEAQQLWAMLDISRRLSASNLLEPCMINCGNRGVANTLTQFQTMAADKELCVALKAAGMTVFVTSLYRVPRVRRTARCVIDDLFPWIVLGVPMSMYTFELDLIPSEIARIIKYASQGDLSPEP